MKFIHAGDLPFRNVECIRIFKTHNSCYCLPYRRSQACVVLTIWREKSIHGWHLFPILMNAQPATVGCQLVTSLAQEGAICELWTEMKYPLSQSACSASKQLDILHRYSIRREHIYHCKIKGIRLIRSSMNEKVSSEKKIEIDTFKSAEITCSSSPFTRR